MKSFADFHQYNEKKKGDVNKSFLLIFKKNVKDGRLEIFIDNKNDSLPGGRCEKDETFEEGLLREIEEETGKELNKKDVKFLEKVKNIKYYYIFLTEKETDGMEPKSDFKNGEWVRIDKVTSKNILTLINKALLNKLNENTAINEYKSYKDIVNNILEKPHSKKKGLLVVFEGIDGAGKTTQVDLLLKYVSDLGYNMEFTRWSSFDLLKKPMKKLKKAKMLDNLSYFLLNAADMNLRYQNCILPALAQNKIAICDRYYYTSLVRDGLRGIDTKVVEDVYKDYLKPDLIFYCKVPIDVAFGRLMNNKGFSYYGAGMDLNYALSIEENCIKYQNEMQKRYTNIFKGMDNVVILDMAKKPEEIFDDIVKVLSQKFSMGKY